MIGSKIRRKRLTLWLDRKIIFLRDISQKETVSEELVHYLAPQLVPGLPVFCLTLWHTYKHCCPEIARITDKAEIIQKKQIEL